MRHLATHRADEAFDFERAPLSMQEQRMQHAAARSLLASVGAASPSSPPHTARVPSDELRDAPRFRSLLTLLHYLVRRVGRPGPHSGHIRLHRGPGGKGFDGYFRLLDDALTLYEIPEGGRARKLRVFGADPRSNDWFLHLPRRLHEDNIYIA